MHAWRRLIFPPALLLCLADRPDDAAQGLQRDIELHGHVLLAQARAGGWLPLNLSTNILDAWGPYWSR